ncbi:hypothetical protein [Streptomyces sp. NPDC001221]
MRIPKSKVLGVTDGFTECGCGGHRGLERTFALMPLDADGSEDGAAEEVAYCSTSCAATALGWMHGKVTDTARGAPRQPSASALRA